MNAEVKPTWSRVVFSSAIHFYLNLFGLDTDSHLQLDIASSVEVIGIQRPRRAGPMMMPTYARRRHPERPLLIMQLAESEVFCQGRRGGATVLARGSVCFQLFPLHEVASTDGTRKDSEAMISNRQPKHCH